MYCRSASPIVEESVFEGNAANARGSAGGALYNDKSNPTFTRCLFVSNSAANGGMTGELRKLRACGFVVALLIANDPQVEVRHGQIGIAVRCLGERFGRGFRVRLAIEQLGEIVMGFAVVRRDVYGPVQGSNRRLM